MDKAKDVPMIPPAGFDSRAARHSRTDATSRAGRRGRHSPPIWEHSIIGECARLITEGVTVQIRVFPPVGCAYCRLERGRCANGKRPAARRKTARAGAGSRASPDFAALLYGAWPAGRSLRRRCRSRFDSDMPRQCSCFSAYANRRHPVAGKQGRFMRM